MSVGLIAIFVFLATVPVSVVLAVALCVMAARADEDAQPVKTVDEQLASMTWDFGAGGWRN